MNVLDETMLRMKWMICLCFFGVMLTSVSSIAQTQDESSVNIHLTITEPDDPQTPKQVFAALSQKIQSKEPALLRCQIRFTPERNFATLLFYPIFLNWLRTPDHLVSFKAEGKALRVLEHLKKFLNHKPKYAKRVDFELSINESLDHVIVEAVFEFQSSTRKQQKSSESFIKRLTRHLKRMERGADEIILELMDETTRAKK